MSRSRDGGCRTRRPDLTTSYVRGYASDDEDADNTFEALEKRLDSCNASTSAGVGADEPAPGERQEVAVDPCNSDVVAVEFLLDGDGAVERLSDRRFEDERTRHRRIAANDHVADERRPALDTVTLVAEMSIPLSTNPRYRSVPAGPRCRCRYERDRQSLTTCFFYKYQVQ